MFKRDLDLGLIINSVDLAVHEEKTQTANLSKMRRKKHPPIAPKKSVRKGA